MWWEMCVLYLSLIEKHQKSFIQGSLLFSYWSAGFKCNCPWEVKTATYIKTVRSVRRRRWELRTRWKDRRCWRSLTSMLPFQFYLYLPTMETSLWISFPVEWGHSFIVMLYVAANWEQLNSYKSDSVIQSLWWMLMPHVFPPMLLLRKGSPPSSRSRTGLS